MARSDDLNVLLEKLVAAFIEQCDDGGPKVTLADCVQGYLDDCYALTERTRGLYTYHLERLVADVGGDRLMSEVSTEVVRSYMADMRRKDGGKYSKSYMNQVYRTLNTFFVWCLQEGAVRKNPLEQIRRPKVPKRKSPRLSLEEVAHLLKTVRERTDNPVRNLAMILLMVDSGLRRGEVVGLEVADVDLESGIVRAFGKDMEDRYVPIGKQTCEALRAYLTRRPDTGEKALFVTTEGTALTSDGLGTLIHRLKERSGIQVYCHLLRHTFANHFIKNGGNLRKLQEILGHASVETTAKIYLSPELPELQDEHEHYSPLH